jgi:hypothetical protein
MSDEALPPELLTTGPEGRTLRIPSLGVDAEHPLVVHLRPLPLKPARKLARDANVFLTTMQKATALVASVDKSIAQVHHDFLNAHRRRRHRSCAWLAVQHARRTAFVTHTRHLGTCPIQMQLEQVHFGRSY